MAYTDEEILQIKLEIFNDTIGELKGMDCKLCNNKGYIGYIDNGVIKSKTCSCVNKRNIMNKLLSSGITQSMIDNYTFDKYEDTEDYQKIIKNKALKYVDDILNNKSKKWFYFGGISGLGKTHICTSIFSKLIDNGLTGRYMIWKNEVPKLRIGMKSFDDVKQMEFNKTMKEFSSVDVLYIDDFLKFVDNGDLDIAYEIINDRYCNDKITIISSEFNKEELHNIDIALCGRIYEKSSEYFLQPIKDFRRNYRLK